MGTTHRPWTFFAGVATAIIGAALLLASHVDPELSLLWTGVALGAGAAIELASGASFTRRGGAGMDHIFAGATLVASASYLVTSWLFDPTSLSPAPLAVLFGVFCAANAIFRAIDLALDRPPAAFTEAIDVVVTLALAIVLLATWREATGAFVALVAGLELLAGGVSITGGAVALWRHPPLELRES